MRDLAVQHCDLRLLSWKKNIPLHGISFFQSTTREDASCGGSCDTVSCMVAYSHGPGFLPAYPAKVGNVF